MATPKKPGVDPELSELRQALTEKLADVSRLEQAIRAKVDDRLRQLHTEVDLPDRKTLIKYLTNLDNEAKTTPTSPEKKEAIRADLLAKLSIEAIALKHKVSKRVVAGIRSKLPKVEGNA